LPDSLQRIEVTVRIAGRTFPFCFAPPPHQADFPACTPISATQPESFTFDQWDGTDIYGRVVQGDTLAVVDVGFIYQRVYFEPAQTQEAFAQASGAQVIPSARPRGELVAGRTWNGTVGGERCGGGRRRQRVRQ